MFLLDLLLQETVEMAENRMKLFLLHTVLLNKLPLKYRAQSVNSTLLDEFSKKQDGKVYPFHEVSVRYLVKKPLSAAGISEDNAQG